MCGDYLRKRQDLLVVQLGSFLTAYHLWKHLPGGASRVQSVGGGMLHHDALGGICG